MKQDYPVYESDKKDCQHYQHKEMFTRSCCGGKIKEIVELIYCKGVPKNSKKCLNCKEYEKINKEKV